MFLKKSVFTFFLLIIVFKICKKFQKCFNLNINIYKWKSELIFCVLKKKDEFKKSKKNQYISYEHKYVYFT